MPARTLLLALYLACAALVGPASAGPQRGSDRWGVAQDHGEGRGGRNGRNDRDEGRAQNLVPLRDVIGMLRSRYGGEQVSVSLERGPRPTYFIRWRMPDGSYRDFRVDAESGQVR
jgi:uncharacterized membrane protein YkoI